MSEEKKIKLGSIVKDQVSGFTGVAVSRTEWLFGCVRVGVEPMSLDKDGKAIDGRSFDEPQLEAIGVHNIAKLAEEEAKTKEGPTYGDRPDIEKATEPSRGR